MTIEIPRFTQTEIEEAAFDGDSAIRIEAEDFFTQTDEDIYLLKDVNGNLMEALQLNTTGVLNWETRMVDDFTYNHILVVTDELLNQLVINICLTIFTTHLMKKNESTKMYIKNKRNSSKLKAFGSYQALCLTESFVL